MKKALYNSTVNRSLQNCVSSVGDFLHVNILGAKNLKLVPTFLKNVWTLCSNFKLQLCLLLKTMKFNCIWSQGETGSIFNLLS